jgi:hypothetical protein
LIRKFKINLLEPKWWLHPDEHHFIKDEEKYHCANLLTFSVLEWISLYSEGMIRPDLFLYHLKGFVREGTDKKTIKRVISGVKILSDLRKNSENESRKLTPAEKYQNSHSDPYIIHFRSKFDYHQPKPPIETLRDDLKSLDSLFFSDFTRWFINRKESNTFSEYSIKEYLNNDKFESDEFLDA